MSGREKKASSFERKKGGRKPNKRYLIVCEGSKTEPTYFSEMRHDLRLRTADIRVCGKECGSDPVSVYRYALDLYEVEKNGAQYDGVFCVFDKDEHKNIDEATRLIGKHAGVFHRVLSYPCFEYWLLLHYVKRVSAFAKTASKSIGGVVESELKKHDRAYQKGGRG
ncbi:TPA: RloB family protein, partial [Pseudomonas aeruginosa]